MPAIPLYSAGDIGVIKDVTPHELPPVAWSNGENIIFRDGKAVRRNGQKRVYEVGQLGQPYSISLAYTPTNVFWVYFDKTKAYATNGGQHAEITRLSGVYSSVDFGRLWGGGMFQGIPVYTNGKDKPQVWTPISLTNRMVDMPNWPALELCNVIRPFKNFLVAMNISRSGSSFPNMIHWSDAADPGSLPTTWDSSDPTNLAGERDLVDEFPGGIREGLTLRDIFVIYKDNAVWGMQFIGGSQIMRTYQILGGIGILGAHCVTQIDKGMKHVFASADDLLVFDGQGSASVLDKKWKKYLNDTIDPTNSERSFIVALEKTTEVWFCYPEIGQEFPNVALVWNWVNGTISRRTFAGNISTGVTGPVEISGDPWDLDTAAWDTDATVWDLATFRAAKFDILMGKPGVDLASSRMLQFETTQQYEAVDYTSFVERIDLAVSGQDASTGAIKTDFQMRKLITRIWPHVEGAPIQVQVGARETLNENDGITWLPAQTFTPGVDLYLDFIIAGRFLAVKFMSSVAGVWKLEGYDLEIQPLGNL